MRFVGEACAAAFLARQRPSTPADGARARTGIESMKAIGLADIPAQHRAFLLEAAKPVAAA